MAILQDFVFFDETSTSGTSNPFRLPYDTSALTVQVEGLSAGNTATITFYGTTETADSPVAWEPLSVINNAGYEVTDDVSKNGIYSIGGAGIRQIRAFAQAALVGTAKVHAVAVNG